jgi:hypothetical protein
MVAGIQPFHIVINEERVGPNSYSLMIGVLIIGVSKYPMRCFVVISLQHR